MVITQGIKECITAPVLTLDPTKPEPITENNQDVEKIRKEERWTNEQGTLFRTYGEFNYKRGSIFANSPITLIIERQWIRLPFIAYTHPQPP